MKIELDKCLLEAAVGGIVGVTAGTLMGLSSALTLATGAILAAALAVQNAARQVLETQYKNSYDPKACGFRLTIAGALPLAVVIAHYAFKIFPPFAVGLALGHFAMEAIHILNRSRAVVSV